MGVVALIPARQGSRRIKDKNIKLLGGKPLMVYTIEAALESRIFDRVIVSTDSKKYAQIANQYGAETVMRPHSISGLKSPDIEWVKYTLGKINKQDCFSILRPTSPFRTPATIKRAWEQFKNAGDIDSLRAVELCKQHPCKMWRVCNNRLIPLFDYSTANMPYQSLVEIYVQNASLEIAYSKVVYDQQSISGKNIIPFFTDGYEGLDINTEDDWERAERIIEHRISCSQNLAVYQSFVRGI